MTAARRSKAVGLASLLTAVALTLAAQSVSAVGAGPRGAVGPPLYPNLVTRRIVDVHIVRSTGTKLLRFSTTVGNRGPGPAELFPDAQADMNDCDGDHDPTNDRLAYQRIFADTDTVNEPADGIFDRDVDIDPFEEVVIGCFIFHVAHNHWHFEEFERYDLRRVHSTKMLASSEKVSFCLLDTFTIPNVPGRPDDPYYGPCNADVTMGLSVGYSDLYSSGLPGQELDIRGLPNGRYCLLMTADPGERVTEANESDNGRSTVIEIAGRTATNLDRRCPGESR
jgi:hypothetical protein